MTHASPGRWLSIIGIGEGGVEALSPAARARIVQARLVVGGRRHLELAGAFPGERLAWPSPPDLAFPAIFARRGEAVCVLATGDPFHFGIGSLLMQHASADETVCLPAPSAFSQVAARLGWALQSCALVSLHGRALTDILPRLQTGRRIMALSWDETTPAKLARLLDERGFSDSRIVVCEALGGPRERIRTAAARGFDLEAIDPLNTIAVELTGSPKARIMPLAPGLPDDWFEHDGQITKRDVRAVTIARLAPRPGACLWDIGAGAGSVAIEWLLCQGTGRAIAVELRQDRADRIGRNAASLGVGGLEIVVGEAPAALANLPAPDSAFVGGAVSRAGVIEVALSALRPGGTLVANAVTLAGHEVLLRHSAQCGGEIVTMQFARAERIGAMDAWRPAMPVMQWSFTKS